MDMINTDNFQEEWREMAGFEGRYIISNLGLIKSLPRTIFDKNGKTHKITGKLLEPILTDGYPRVTLRKDGKTFYIMVHRLVAATFIGPCPKGQEVRHKDGTRNNPSLYNLEYGTRLQNINDCKKHGAFKNGASHLTEEMVREIAERGDDTAKVLAAEYAVSISTIAGIRRRRVWAHLNLTLRESYLRSGDDHPARRGKQKISDN